MPPTYGAAGPPPPPPPAAATAGFNAPKGAGTQEMAYADDAMAKAGLGTWMKANWCWAVRIILAIVGITVPLIMFLKPCEDVEIVSFEMIQPPLDLYLLLDASGSMRYDWYDCKQAAVNLAQTFGSTLSEGQLRVGGGIFSTGSYVFTNFTSDIDYATSEIANWEMDYGGTNYEAGLNTFFATWMETKNLDEYANTILIMVSDGQPNGGNDPDYSEISYILRNDWGIYIMGIMVTSDDDGTGIEALESVSTCADMNDTASDGCIWFADFADFDTFVENAEGIAESLADTVGQANIEHRQSDCVKGPWLIFLLLLLPLLAVCILPYILSLRRNVVIKRKKPPPFVPPVAKNPPPPPPEALKARPPPPPPLAAKPKVEKPRFKWKIQANDHYLWSTTGGGAAPMKVDWAGKAPPSAPVDPHAEKVRVRLSVQAEPVAVRDLGDGYIEEEYIEEKTLEQWTEEKAGVAFDKAKWFLCCGCCSGYKKLDEPKNEPENHAL